VGIPRRLPDVALTAVPPAVAEMIGAYLETAALLGRRTADLHLVLASDERDPSFRPEPYVPADRRSKYQSMRNLVGKAIRQLRDRLARVPPSLLDQARALAVHPERALKALEPLLMQGLTGLRIRIHGDYHLDQLLNTGKDFVIIDFEGPPGELLAERRRKHSALRDIAGMVRSFHYAAITTLHDGTVVREVDRELVSPWAEAWHRFVSSAFLRAYLDATGGAAFLPTREDLPLVLETHVIEKAFMELTEALELDTDTVGIPLVAVLDFVEASGA
jgi:maltose alpha-D-glucosyltransferase/alpha-amylase